MEFEYGKIAYLKMLELEKELSALKNSLTQKTSNDIFLTSENDNNNSSQFSKTLVFNVIESGKYNFHGNIKCEFENHNDILVNFYLNSQLLYTTNVTSLLDKEYEFDTICQSGKNQLTVTFHAQNVFNLKTINANIFRYESDNGYHRVSRIHFDGVEFILLVNDDTATLYKLIENQNELIELLTFKCKDACIIDAGTNYLQIIYIDEKADLIKKFIGFASNYVKDEPLNVSGVQSVCGYKEGEYLKIIYSRFSQIYYCYYNSLEGITVEKTQRKGNVVYADPEVVGVYIIVDFASKTKLVIE